MEAFDDIVAAKQKVGQQPENDLLNLDLSAAVTHLKVLVEDFESRNI